MSKDARFWRNVIVIGLAHVAMIVGLVRWSHASKPASTQSIVWMNGGAGNGGIATTARENTPVPKPVKVAAPAPPEPAPSKTEPPEEDRPDSTTARSDIQLAAPKPSPSATPKPSPTPLVKATPKSGPKPKPTPKPSPKASPKPSPRKTVLAKASPKPSPKVKPTPEESDEQGDATEAEAEKKQIAKPDLEKKTAEHDPAPNKVNAVQPGTGKGTSGGRGGHAGGAGGDSPFGWYGSMLHDRLYSEWIQPTTSLSSGAKVSALVKIRIEKDGRVSNFEIVKPSGNEVVDESVSAVAKRVVEVDPLPAGLGNGEHYDVKINFELNSEQ